MYNANVAIMLIYVCPGHNEKLLQQAYDHTG